MSASDEDRDDCWFVQKDDDRRQIFALVRRDGRMVAFGPLTADLVDRGRYEGPRGAAARGQGDEALARELAVRGDEFHDLDDFYPVYGYPPEVLEWVESTDLTVGRELDDVARRLGIDRSLLREASWHESHDPGAVDAEGNTLFYPVFWDNWSVGDMAGRYTINPKSYRFKAWLSFHT